MTFADPEALHRLLDLQELDRSLDALRHRRQTMPELQELERIDAAKASLDSEAGGPREQRHALGREQRRLEDEVAMVEDRIGAEDAKLYGGKVTGVKELQALQDEILGLKDRRGNLEDSILEVMEASEPLDVLLAGYATRHAELDRQADDASARLTEASAEIDAEMAEVERSRAETLAAIPEELVSVYERLRSQPGRIGVARLIGTTCHGCHLELAAVEVDRLKKLPKDALVHCDECGCILVR